MPRERVELSRFDGYWDKARVPKLDKVRAVPDAGGERPRRGAAARARSTGSRCPPPDAMPRLKQGGMPIVTNKYPHNWA